MSNDNIPTSAADWQNLHAACTIMEGFHNFIRLRCDCTVATVAIDNLPEGGWFVGIETQDGRGFAGRGETMFDACQDIEPVYCRRVRIEGGATMNEYCDLSPAATKPSGVGRQIDWRGRAYYPGGVTRAGNRASKAHP